MNILLLGAGGMAGKLFLRYIQNRPSARITYTSRDKTDPEAILLDASDLEAVRTTIHRVRPDIIVNMIGILNQNAENDPLQAYIINGLLPHWLRHCADETDARLVHISTDCVFSGEKGMYTEIDTPDGSSVYARTKMLGEVHDPKHITIRTSIVGPDDKPEGIGLLQWFLNQSGTIQGYQNVMWNGVTTLELAKAIEYAAFHPQAGGLVHLAAEQPLSKHEMLELFRDTFQHDVVTIIPTALPVLNRTLSVTRTDWGYQAPGIPAMVQELADWMKES